METLDLNESARGRCETLGLEFMLRILEVELALRPGNLEALADLGHLYTRLGRYAEGLAADRRLARVRPDDPTVQYNLACSLALTGDPTAALEALETAADLGFDDLQLLLGDDDLAALRDDPRFLALADRLGA